MPRTIANLLLSCILFGVAASTSAEPLASDPDPQLAPAFALPERLPPVDPALDDEQPILEEELPFNFEEPAVELDAQPVEPPDSRRPKIGGGPFGGGSPIGYSAFFEPTVNVEDQPTDFAHVGQDIRLMAPAWTSDPHKVLVSAAVANDLFDTAAVFPTSGTEFPDMLWNIRVGTFYMRELANDWRLTAGINVGSASDQPFAAIRDVNPALFALLNIPRPDENAWNLSLFYSPLSEIPYPLPGVAYYWHASDSLQMNIGLPAQLVYTPHEAFVFTASYMLLHNINVRGTWLIDDNWSAYAAYENRNRAWFLHDRDRDDDRLFSYDQGVFVGLQRPIWKKLQADVSAGYLFERFYFIGENYSDRHLDRIDLEAGALISAALGLAF